MFLAFVLSLLRLVEADCYSHDQVLANNSVPYYGPELVSCGNGTNNCCLHGQECGSNLLCKDPNGDTSRQYCADRYWSQCSTLCSEYDTAGTYLTVCGNNIFCCTSSNDTCCDNGTGYFVHPDSGIVQPASEGSTTALATYWSVDSAAILQSASTSQSSSSTSSTISTPTTTTTTTSDASASSNSLPTTASATISTATLPSSQPSPVTSSNGLSAGAGAGIGVGGAVAVAGIVALAWLLFRERKKRRQLQASVGHGGQPHNSHPTTNYGPEYIAAYKSPIGQTASRVDQPGNAQYNRYELENNLRHEMSPHY
ncbi:hypothetical protein BDV96DRAFT_597966 [Lophiotrema nucula]|uniref:Mid2 domain-containing protein n=1 Tax=Lophiotrema nucula TaxID=690887 RepID=A0A6A5ZBX5_9PLEO|nr:hypothetical protein BDV96DRAFT_597966 [Lophiotrema nucula]